MRRALSAALLVVLVAAATPASAEAEPVWRRLVGDLPGLSHGPDVRGELLWVHWAGGRAHVRLLEVSRRDGQVTVRNPDGYTVAFGSHGGLANHEEGWFVSFPPVADFSTSEALDLLEEKYHVRLRGVTALVGRDCARVDLTLRGERRLRERLCVDTTGDLVLRRETYGDGGRLERLAAYLSLETGMGALPRLGATARRAVPLERRTTGTELIDPERLGTLREEGWTAPEELPGGYVAVGAALVSSGEGDATWDEALKVVYHDGLYSVSLFQQHGHPDWGALPDGAAPATVVDWRAYEWPGAVPHRLVWEASGSTYSLVGDPPTDDFAAIAAALPRPSAPGLVERLKRGLGRLWSWVSPWN